MRPAPLRTTSRKGKSSLRSISILGLVLVVLGVVCLRMGHFSYHNWIPAVDAGPIHEEAHMDHRISVPTASGFFVLLAGIGFIAVRWRRA
jgi:hypothetical protein